MNGFGQKTNRKQPFYTSTDEINGIINTNKYWTTGNLLLFK